MLMSRHRASIGQTDVHQRSALHLAAQVAPQGWMVQGGHLGEVLLLLRVRAEVESRDQWGRTPLSMVGLAMRHPTRGAGAATWRWWRRSWRQGQRWTTRMIRCHQAVP